MTAIPEKLKNKKIGVLYGGTSSERDISLKSGGAVIAALKKMKLKVAAIDVDKNAAEKIKKEKIDLAYIALHGTFGEDGTIQGMLEVMGIQYTGSGVFASAVSMDKNASKILFECSAILTPQWFVLRKFEPFDAVKKYPVVVKPANQGSAIGISIVKKAAEFAPAVKTAFKYDDEIIVEQFIKGREITVGVLDGKALPAVEIVPKGKFYDYKSKYDKGGSEHIIPARISKKAYERAAFFAEKVHRVFKCRAACRVDMIVDNDDKIWVLENNTIPGMTETSLLPDEARAAGINFEELIIKILECSL
jgi:D-alanine-D-alanine ligase